MISKIPYITRFMTSKFDHPGLVDLKKIEELSFRLITCSKLWKRVTFIGEYS